MAEPRAGHSAKQKTTGKAAARPAKKRSWPKRIALALVVYSFREFRGEKP